MSELKGAHVVIADDQLDVARTLTQPLRSAGAVLDFAIDGEAALQRVLEGGVDLLIVDMKMPPHEWGGLWLLEQLRERGIGCTTIVLSGEGQQRQTVEALRLGAADWISKSHADVELVPRCTEHLEAARAGAVEDMVTRGPSPLAYAYARYRRSIGGELQYAEGIRLCEELVRFTALVGLAAACAERGDRLRHLDAGRLARPSFGTWEAVLHELRNNVANQTFTAIARGLMPNGNREFRAIVKLRNDQDHAGPDPGSADRELVFRTVGACAHRMLCTPLTIGSHARMFKLHGRPTVEFREYRGAFTPRITKMTLAAPHYLESPDPYLYAGEQEPLPLEPWMCVFSEGDMGTSQLGVFDGMATAHRDRLQPSDVLLYTHPAAGKRRLQRTDRVATWSLLQSIWSNEGQ